MKYTINIPKPCNEKWSEMTPTERGAFCSNCQKEVLDFTAKSNQQLAILLNQNKKLCGKFKSEQLNVAIPSAQGSKTSQVGFFVGISTLLALSTPVFGQNNTPKALKTELLNKGGQEFEAFPKSSDSITIKGQVEDTEYPLPGANIHLKGTHYGTQTDFDGNFSLAISKKMIETNPMLIVSYIGFETKEIQVNEMTSFFNIVLKDNEEFVTTGIVVVEKHNIFRRIGNLFKKKHKESCDE